MTKRGKTVRKVTAMLLAMTLVCGVVALGNRAVASKPHSKVVYESATENEVYAATSTTTGQDVRFGDVNGDGDVNNKDLGLLQRYINGWSVEIDVIAADISGDGEINNKDLGLLQRYINGWDVQLPTTTTTTTTTTTATATTTTTTTTTQPEEPQVELPKRGYSPDNRIKLGDVTLSGQTVTMEICNASAVWEPEDGKSYFEYTCYDENGSALSVGKINFGYIQSKSSKTFTFDIPKGTVKVVLTDFKAEYWSVPI